MNFKIRTKITRSGKLALGRPGVRGQGQSSLAGGPPQVASACPQSREPRGTRAAFATPSPPAAPSPVSPTPGGRWCCHWLSRQRSRGPSRGRGDRSGPSLPGPHHPGGSEPRFPSDVSHLYSGLLSSPSSRPAPPVGTPVPTVAPAPPRVLITGPIPVLLSSVLVITKPAHPKHLLSAPASLYFRPSGPRSPPRWPPALLCPRPQCPAPERDHGACASLLRRCLRALSPPHRPRLQS